MTARNNQINWDKGFWLDTAEHRQAAVQSLCDHLGNQLYSMYRLGTQNCLTASCQHKQNPVCYCSDEGQRKEKEILGVTEGVPFFLFHSWLCPLTVILPSEEAAVPSSFCSSTALGNHALCFYGWLEAILAFLYIFPIYNYLVQNRMWKCQISF